MKQQITVCRNCRIPLIFTFLWDYNELFCINCFGHWGMMGGGDRVDSTPELKKQNRLIQKIWKSIGKNLIPRGSYKKDKCKKCTDYNHNLHLTKLEKVKNKIATRVLKNLKGAWN